MSDPVSYHGRVWQTTARHGEWRAKVCASAEGLLAWIDDHGGSAAWHTPYTVRADEVISRAEYRKLASRPHLVIGVC